VSTCPENFSKKCLRTFESGSKPNATKAPPPQTDCQNAKRIHIVMKEYSGAAVKTRNVGNRNWCENDRPGGIPFLPACFLDLTFSTFPAGSKGVFSFPDGCFCPGSHLSEMPGEGMRKAMCMGDLECAKAR